MQSVYDPAKCLSSFDFSSTSACQMGTPVWLRHFMGANGDRAGKPCYNWGSDSPLGVLNDIAHEVSFHISSLRGRC
jgi:hypothetical protein